MPTRLLHQAAHKLAALDVLPHPVRPERERPLPAAEVDPEELSEVQRELLVHADGRRTARDIAFRTGRAVYTITVEMARLLGEGHLQCLDAAGPPVRIPARVPPEGLRRRKPPATEPAAVAPAPPPPPPPASAPSLRPRPQPGPSPAHARRERHHRDPRHREDRGELERVLQAAEWIREMKNRPRPIRK
jgi:hypothetical protein